MHQHLDPGGMTYLVGLPNFGSYLTGNERTRTGRLMRWSHFGIVFGLFDISFENYLYGKEEVEASPAYITVLLAP